MPTEVILPRVDMDMAKGKVSRWFVEENAKVQKGQVIFEIETDKAAMEIESPASGTIRDLVSDNGKEVPVGSIVARIYGDSEAYAPPAQPAAVQAADTTPLELLTADAPATATFPSPASAPHQPAGGTEVSGMRATPLARRLAREHRIELTQLRGSGPGGRIQQSDVLAYVAAASPTIDAKPAAPPSCRARAEQAATSLQNAGPLHRVWLRQGNGTPLVLIHGFGSDLNSWRPFIASLPQDRPVLGIDLPGHGGSLLDRQSTLAALAASVLDTLLAEDLSSLHLIGHSLGAAVAAAVASQSQLDIRSLMLLSPAGLGPDMNGAFISGFLRATSEASIAPWIRQLAFDERTLGASFVSATLRSRSSELTKAQEQLAANVFPDGTQAFSIRHLFESFDWPVKVIFGAEDRIIPARHATGLPGTVAIHVFSATGHMPQLEQRHAVGRLATELARLG